MTLIVMFLFWLSSSYIEYKIVLGYPRLQPWFRGVRGIAISLLIGAALSWAVGASNALPIVAAQMIGLATNEIMFKFFYTLEHRVIPTSKRGISTVRSYNEKRVGFKKAHPAAYQNAKESLVAGASLIGKLVMFFVMVIGAPVVIKRKIQARYNNMKIRLHNMRTRLSPREVMKRRPLMP